MYSRNKEKRYQVAVGVALYELNNVNSQYNNNNIISDSIQNEVTQGKTSITHFTLQD